MKKQQTIQKLNHSTIPGLSKHLINVKDMESKTVGLTYIDKSRLQKAAQHISIAMAVLREASESITADLVAALKQEMEGK